MIFIFQRSVDFFTSDSEVPWCKFCLVLQKSVLSSTTVKHSHLDSLEPDQVRKHVYKTFYSIDYLINHPVQSSSGLFSTGFGLLKYHLF